ncbi:3',5'-cyclic AMP phosphodiesterase CpdA [Rhizobium sp. RU20A]|uniref:metallophosphoesterase family protein n=1 Tax=Rhizobium sp. RU20A TaxID=1907412 RepID=UPI000954E5AA|nr:metallophosphoesterase [Rhizobium sp. RU20A]SIQ19010.1 3',5'-cyclic AMP phosphodiesterase CpdA [Rhizobium sp. RU20A]
MRFIIVSDIHCMSKELKDVQGGYAGSQGSSFFIEERVPSRNPIMAIEQAVSDFDGSIDAILCLGDMAHQSKRLPMLQAWTDLHELGRKLNVPDIVGITGNHDLLSRVDSIEDAENRTDFLKNISPRFPNKDEAFSASYFQNGVASKEFERCLLIAVDTCRWHGLGKDDKTSEKIWNVGHVSDTMRQEILAQIRASALSHVVIIMHHHPIKVDDILDTEEDQMSSGAQLLADIGDTDKNCIVIHGHKHQVNIKRHSKGLRPPIIFSSATFAARPYPSQTTGFYNQFHILEFDTNKSLFPSGAIYSWNWAASAWIKSKLDTMPFRQAFGPEILLEKLAAELAGIPLTSKVARQELFAGCPDLEFLPMSQFDDLNEILMKKYKRMLVAHQSTIQAMIEAS